MRTKLASLLFLVMPVVLFACEVTAAPSQQITEVQQQLQVLGYDPGPIDGIMGPRTRQAITRFQRDHELPGTGHLTNRTLTELRVAIARVSPRVRSHRQSEQTSTLDKGTLLWWLIGGIILLLYYLVKREPAENREEVTGAKQTTSSGTNVHPSTSQTSLSHYLDHSTEFAVGHVRPTRTAGHTRQPKKTTWIPAGHSVSVAGFEIGGMVYVGNPHCGSPPWKKENCVIDPTVPVARGRADHAGTGMPYWPCYAEIDPACRRAYLEWLASGRNDPEAYIGYVFLYFYGLERRLFVDSPNEEEKRAIFAEVERLRKIYAGNGSFDRYSKALLDCRPLLIKDGTGIEPPMERHRGWELPLGVKLGIGKLVAREEPISGEWLLSWWLAHPETRLRTPAKRAFDEFKELFLHRFRQRFPDGVKVKRPKTDLSHRYRAASGTFEVQFRSEPKGIPDISRLKRPLGIADRIATGCMDALDPFSRFIGRNPEARESLEAHCLLPPEIRSRIPNPGLEALKEWVTTAKKQGPVPVEILLERVMGEMPERITRSMLTRASRILLAVETGFAPDPLFSFIAPRRGDLVVLFDIGKAKPPTEAEKKNYEAALLVLTLGALVAHADGRIDPAERRHLLEHIERTRGLSKAYKARLRANLDWLVESPPPLRTLKKHFAGLSDGDKAAVGRLLLAIAGADSVIDPSEIVVLEKIFEGLGLHSENLYSELHALSVCPSSDDPVTVRPAAPIETGYQIPKPPEPLRSEGEQRIVLDQSRIAAIMAETNKVSSTLGAIFSEEEDGADEAGDGCEDPEEILLGPDPKHDALIRVLLARSRWAGEEFERLARQFDLMPNGALETLNEWAFEAYGDLLIEGDETLEINAFVAEQIGDAARRTHP